MIEGAHGVPSADLFGHDQLHFLCSSGKKNHLDPDSLSFFISAESETWKREAPLIEQLGEGGRGWTLDRK